MPRGPLAPFALVLASLASACFESGPPAWAPNPVSAARNGEACVRARGLRERAPALFEEGRLDRTIRILQRAEELCPAEAPATWALRVRALAAVGRSAEAMQLAGRIEISDRAGDADRVAAKEARAVAEAHGRLVVERGSRRDAPELFDPAEKRRAEGRVIFHRAAAAARAGDHAAAEKLFLDAWEAWHPDPRALVEAGWQARLAGKKAEAQALFDRAAFDDATVAVRPELPVGAPSIQAGRALSFSPDGALLAVGGDDEVVVFDAELHPVLRLRTGEAVLSLAFAGEGLLCAGLDGGVVRVFDVVTGAALRDLPGHRAAVRALAVSPDGRALASASDDGSVRLWDPAGGVEIRSLRPPRGAVALAFDPTGGILAIAGEDGRIPLWDTRTGTLAGTVPARGGAVRALAFEGPALLVVGAIERVRWDLGRPRQPRATVLGRARAERGTIASNAAGAGHAVVAAVAGAELGVSDAAGTAALAASSGAEHEGVVAFALAPAGNVLGVVFRDRTVALLPAAERREPRVLAHGGPVDALAPTPDGKTLAAAVDGRVLLWRAEGDRLRAIDASGARSLAFSPDGRTLAVGLDRGQVTLRDLAGGKPNVDLGAAGAVQSLAFSPDGGRLAAGTAAPSVQVFALGAAGEPRALPLDAGPVRAARFSPDGSAVLIAGRDGLTLWKPAGHEGVHFVPYGPEIRDAAFTPDGAGMVVANMRGELLFGKPAPSAPAPARTLLVPGQVLALAIAADGTIATAEGDRAIDLRSPVGKSFQRFRDPDAAMREVAFLPAHVAAGLADGSVRLYRAPATGPVVILSPVSGLGAGKVAGVVRSPDGHLEIVGPDATAARAAIRCRLGPALYPLEVCAEQFEVEGLLKLVLAGKDPAEADP